MRKGGVRNVWCPVGGGGRSFLLFASGLLLSFPYTVLLEAVTVEQNPGGGGGGDINVTFKWLACLPVLPCHAFHVIVLVWWTIFCGWYIARQGTHFGAGFCHGVNLLLYVLNLRRAILSSKEDDGEEESPAEGSASAGSSVLCLTFAISVWHAIWMWVLIKTGAEAEETRRGRKGRNNIISQRSCSTVVFARGSHDENLDEPHTHWTTLDQPTQPRDYRFDPTSMV
jgi:hypothetical protein